MNIIQFKERLLVQQIKFYDFYEYDYITGRFDNFVSIDGTGIVVHFDKENNYDRSEVINKPIERKDFKGYDLYLF